MTHRSLGGRRALFRWLGSVLTGLLALAAAHARASTDERSPWTIEDSIALRYIVQDMGNPVGFWPRPKSVSPILPSPSGRRFFYVARRGDLARDCNIFELRIFDTTSVGGAVRARRARAEPMAAASLCSGSPSTFNAGLTNPAWVGEDRIAFLGIDGRTPQGVFEYDLVARRLVRRTPIDMSVRSFSATAGALIFTVQRRERTDAFPYPVASVGMNGIRDWAAGGTFTRSVEIYVQRGNGLPRLVDRAGELRPFGEMANDELQLSPDGNWAVAQYAPAADLRPERWAGYRQADASSVRFMLVDMRRGTATPVVDAPWGIAASNLRSWWEIASDRMMLSPRMLWTSDSKRVVVVNTALPLDGSEARTRTAYVVAVDPVTRQWESLSALTSQGGREPATRARQIGWTTPGTELLLTQEAADGQRVSGKAWRWTGTSWSARETLPTTDLPPPAFSIATQIFERPILPGRLMVELRQGANLPPALVARIGRAETLLSEPDPVLEDAHWRPTQEISWTDPDGRTEKGGLVLPPRARNAPPPPLVIQAYAYTPEAFLPDGFGPTGFAAQALVARGFAVLSIGIPSNDRPAISTSPAEGTYFVRRVDRVVSELASRGLVDRERVGMIGFSRGGWSTLYAMTHPGAVPIRAAINADGMAQSYLDYLIEDGAAFGRDGVTPMEAIYGGGTFWNNRSGWLAGAPAFNVQNVRAPVMFQMVNHQQLLYAPEIIGAFNINARPFEYLIFGPDGFHWLQTPQSRSASLRATVDWFSFWLQGQPPADAVRARRWRLMKSNWDRQQAWEAAGNPVGSAPPAHFAVPAPQESATDR